MQMDSVTTKIQKAIQRVASADNQSTVKSMSDEGMFAQIRLVRKDIDFPQFLPMLWQDNMKEPNEKYGELTSKLKESILQALSNTGDSRGFSAQNMDMFIEKLDGLWKAIKNETWILRINCFGFFFCNEFRR